MMPGVITAAASAGILTLLLVVFHIENRRGVRFFEGVRDHLDTMVARLWKTLGQLATLFGKELFRHIFHYSSHKILTSVLAVVRFVEARATRLVRANKALARRAAENRTERTKLDAVAEHKADTVLSEDERRARKEDSIGTRL